MQGLSPSVPLGTEVGPLQVSKGCGVQVGGGLMAIGPWPRGPRDWLKVLGLSTGLGAGSSVTSANAIPQARIPTGFTFGSSSSSGHLRIALGSKFPEHQSAKGGVPEGDTSLHSNDVLGGELTSMADADGCADEHIQGGVPGN